MNRATMTAAIDTLRLADAFRIGGDVALVLDRSLQVSQVVSARDGEPLDDWTAGLVGRPALEAWAQAAHEPLRAIIAEAWQGRAATCARPCELAIADRRQVFRISALQARGAETSDDEIMLVCRDVSALQHRQEQLDWLASHARGIVSATAEIVWHADADQRAGRRFSSSTLDGDAMQDSRPREVWLQTIHPDDRARIDAYSRSAMPLQRSYVMEYRFRNADGEYHWVEDRVEPVHNGEGRLCAWVGVISDIHERVMVQDALRISEERLRLAIDAAQVGVWDVNLATGERQWSETLKAMLGLSPDASPSEPLLFSLIHPDDRLHVWLAHRDCFETIDEVVFRINRADSGEERWLLSRGQAVLDDDGVLSRRLGTMQDITDRKRAERKLWRAANEDHLTALPNRALFTARLKTMIIAAGASGSSVGLLLVDLDRFKAINDTLGHDAGDAVLRFSAERMLNVCPAHGLVARLGGDEFAMLVPRIDEADLSGLAETVIDAITAPMGHLGFDIRCSASVGVALTSGHGGDGAELLKNADLALYAAKKAGRDRHAVFERTMGRATQLRASVLAQTREALRQGEIVPFYQPKVDPKTGQVLGFEALLRWRHAMGLRLPAALTDAFADPTLSPMIGQVIFGQVAHDLSRWQESGIEVGHVSVNVAAAEFSSGTLADRWLEGLSAHRLAPTRLQIEVTEAVLLADGGDVVARTLDTLRQAGIAIALDDFGAGGMCLGHLSRLPLDWIKIDPSLVACLPDGGRNAAVVQAVVDLAHAFDIGVVAEAVETDAQVKAVRERGCDLIQGFVVAKPMPATRVPYFLDRWMERQRALPPRPLMQIG